MAWKNPNPMPTVICITHTHIDHCNALPMLLRTEASPAILAPQDHIKALKEMADMTWAVKSAGWDPDETRKHKAEFSAIPQDSKRSSLDDTGLVTQLGNKTRRWVPVEPNNWLDVPMKGKWSLAVVKCFHTIETVGYVMCESGTERKGVDEASNEQYHGLLQSVEKLKATCNKAEAGKLGRHIGQMLRGGLITEARIDLPRLAFLCDTTVQVFGPCSACKAGQPCPIAANPFGSACPPAVELAQQVSLIFQCSTVVVECSFIACDMHEAEAEKHAVGRGHIAWSQLRPIVESHPEIDFILIHFSERYSDSDLRTFFTSASSSGCREPNVLVWLDEGLWRGDEAHS